VDDRRTAITSQPEERMTTAQVPETGAARRITLQCQSCHAWNRVDARRAADRPKCGKCAQPMLLDRPWMLTSDSFRRTLAESNVPVLVDFYADWCGPCRMMAPAVDALAAKYQGRVLVAKLDTERAPQLSQQLNVTGLPTTAVFVGGREVERAVGAIPARSLEALAEAGLRGAA
jgi:thioredoxin 2